MNNKLPYFFIFGFFLFISFFAVAQHDSELPQEEISQEQLAQQSQIQAPPTQQEVQEKAEEDEEGHSAPAPWSVIPFITLLAMIATGPLFYAHFWHKNYPYIAAGLGLIVVVYYLGILHDSHHPLHAFFEYFSFIALIAGLFITSGGILIKVDKEGTPLVNVMLLVVGAFIANIIGTTGASMVLIRPFIRLNRGRIQPYHIVFFIFMVSNVGGSLTPIGDPPLFLGFLKGVPFEWTVIHLWPKWIFGIGLLAIFFYFIDKRNYRGIIGENNIEMNYTGKMGVRGLSSSFFLLIVIIAVFMDPNIFGWLPGLMHDDVTGSFFVATANSLSSAKLANVTTVSFVREFIMISAAILAFKTANKKYLAANEFNFEPIKEVGYLFIGIFATMMPALQLIGAFAQSPDGRELVNVHTLYWATGALSGFLDNAPTYLNFLAAGMGESGLNLSIKEDVLQYTVVAVEELTAISIAAVFFGAMTYIGNAPNFMVKSIAEQSGIQMPSFMGYMIRYAIPVLVPILFLTWLVFFVIF